MRNGIILFVTTGMLVKAEKLLISEGVHYHTVTCALRSAQRLRHRSALSLVAIRNH